MTRDYFKVCWGGRGIRTHEVPVEGMPGDAAEEIQFRNAALPGYDGTQEFFFFDDRQPESIREAFDHAKACAATRPKARLSVWKTPKVQGPWDGVRSVLEAPIGEELPS